MDNGLRRFATHLQGCNRLSSNWSSPTVHQASLTCPDASGGKSLPFIHLTTSLKHTVGLGKSVAACVPAVLGDRMTCWVEVGPEGLHVSTRSLFALGLLHGSPICFLKGEGTRRNKVNIEVLIADLINPRVIIRACDFDAFEFEEKCLGKSYVIQHVSYLNLVLECGGWSEEREAEEDKSDEWAAELSSMGDGDRSNTIEGEEGRGMVMDDSMAVG
ncbi:hypothetical protein BKA82DRAFT_4021216 [Pisolithus tinctorius]|nr:hypothetical protein BKA82DRAFT_4021216 [Pisolithus tinctorius]